MKLIDKAALVAEIEKTYNFHKERGGKNDASICDVLYGLLYRINTLEVKDVDLEEESELIANGIMIGVQANKYHTCVYNTERCDFNHSHLMLAARKGIELGLKIHKNEI